MCTKQVDLGYTVLDIKKCISLAENVSPIHAYWSSTPRGPRSWLQVPKCHKNVKKYCIDTTDPTMCGMWFAFCNELWAPVVDWTGRSRSV